MLEFIKKNYNILLRQNSWWLEQFQTHQSRPMLAGFCLFIGYIIIYSLFDITPNPFITSLIVGASSILISISGILWIREGEYPYYITGVFKGSNKYQKIQAVFWVIFWSGMGLAIIITTILDL